jgi:hypothetical protein
MHDPALHPCRSKHGHSPAVAAQGLRMLHGYTCGVEVHEWSGRARTQTWVSG